MNSACDRDSAQIVKTAISMLPALSDAVGLYHMGGFPLNLIKFQGMELVLTRDSDGKYSITGVDLRQTPGRQSRESAQVAILIMRRLQ